MLEYARWKYILVAVVLAVALLFALPNCVWRRLRVADRAQGSRRHRCARQLATIETVLKDDGVAYTSAAIEDGNVIVRFADNESQLNGRDVVKDEKNGLSREYVNAMMYASRAPRWMQALGLRAMPLGLDLRGGLYLLYQVDVDGAVAQLLNTYDQDFRRALNADEHHVHRRQHAHRRFGHPERPARVAAGGRGSRRRCGPRSRRRSPTSPAATPIVADGAGGRLRHDRAAGARAPRLRASPPTSPRCAIASTSSACPSPSCSARASTASSSSCRACRTRPK